MPETRDMPTIESSFARKTALGETEWPDREVEGDFTTQTIRDWLTIHGFPNGRSVSQVDIVSGTVGVGAQFYLVVKAWYCDPATGKKFFMRPPSGDGEEVAWERRMTPLLCLPGDDPGNGVTFEDIKTWLAPYGIGKRIGRPIHLEDIPPVFSVTEWHLEDGKFGPRTTHIRGTFTPEEKGE